MQKMRDLMRSRKRRLLALLALLLLLVAGASISPLQGANDAEAGDKKLGSEVLGNREQQDDASTSAAAADKRAPDVTVSFPAAGGNYGIAAWDAGCSPRPGICGSASDASGVASVELSIRQDGGKYWTGTGFDSVAPVFLLLPAPATTAWSYPLDRPADGTYLVSVKASDTKGNTTPSNQLVTRRFQVDTTPPTAPVIVRHPDDVTFDTSASFRFDHPGQGATYRCQLDDQAAAACKRDVNYKKLSTEDHRFQVWAVDAAGNASPPAEYSWTVLIRKQFGIQGEAGVGLRPGTGTALDLVMSNPFKFPIRVVEMSVMATGPASCSATENLETVSSSFKGDVVIPANSARSLSELKVPSDQWPQLRMKNSGVNQNACKNASFQLTYKGTGTKS